MSLVSRLDVKPSPDLGAISPDEARWEWNWAWDGLIGHWVMWEGAGAPRDISGNGHHATLPGGTANPTWVASERGWVLDFDGSDDEVTVAADTSLNVDTGSFTVSAWVNIDNVPSSERHPVIQKKTPSGVSDDKLDFILTIAHSGEFSADANGDVVFGFGNGSNTNTHDSTTTLDANQRYHVVGVFDRDNQRIKIYIDGVEDINEARTSVPESNGYPIIIGAHYNSSGVADQRYDGSIDDVRIYNRALTAAEIKLLYLYPFGPLQPAWMDSVGGLLIPKDAAAPVVAPSEGGIGAGFGRNNIYVPRRGLRRHTNFGIS